MVGRLFQPSQARDPSPEVLERAEQSLMAETLLRAISELLAELDPRTALEHVCASIVNATPHIPLVWAWLGRGN